MSTELTVALVAPLVAGVFGLIPLMVQIVTTRAQRRDRMTRLNYLLGELELLERLHALQGKVDATDEAAKPRTDLVISDALSKLVDRYVQLSEITPSATSGELSILRRRLLMYKTDTTSGKILHTLFHMLASLVVIVPYLLLPSIVSGVFGVDDILFLTFIFFIPSGIVLLIVHRLARRNDARHAPRLKEPTA
jgi:VIT1/CCC1 family predicted Fe2+/Mn2+ transporter